jgi:hypothetical protein
MRPITVSDRKWAEKIGRDWMEARSGKVPQLWSAFVRHRSRMR